MTRDWDDAIIGLFPADAGSQDLDRESHIPVKEVEMRFVDPLADPDGTSLFFRIPTQASFTPRPGPEFCRRATATSRFTFVFPMVENRRRSSP